MSPPLVSVSGVRGIVSESFTEDLVRAWTKAFAQHCHPERREGSQDSSAPAFAKATADRSLQNDMRIVLGRDTRPSGKWALNMAAQVLVKHGFQPITVGIAPTPTVQLAVTNHRAGGGLIITASHNPSEWNGLKFLGPDGVFLSADEVSQLQNLVEADLRLPGEAPAKLGVPPDGGRAQRPSPMEYRVDDLAIARHIENVLALPVDAARIRARKFRVVLDPVNGTGALAVPPLLERLGCAVTMINGEPNGHFAHPPEPTPTNLQDLGAAVREQRADLGIAVDPDADRLVLADETGTVLSEEYTVTLAAMSVLSLPVILSEAKNLATRDPSSRRSGIQDDKRTVVVNLSTTRMVDDVARQFGATVVRTPVGERHVVEGMRQHGALIGGEGNGGVIFPKSHEGRDSLVGIALILDLLAKRSVTLSAFVSSLPGYTMVKEKLPRGSGFDTQQLSIALQRAFPDTQMTTLDGVRLDTADGWVHLRPSNTEPIIRLITEGTSREAATHLSATVRALLAVPV